MTKKAPHDLPAYSTAVGADGFPVDPNHPFNLSGDLQIEEEQARFIRRRLRRYQRAYLADVPIALADAVRFYSRFKIPPPGWLVGGISAALSGRWPKRRPGRGRRRDDMKDFYRWDLVVNLREQLKANGEWKSWEDCFWRVMLELEDLPEAGSEEAIRKSYQRVNRRLRSASGRYYLPDLG